MNELQQIILRESSIKGPITCARFMELALYHPDHGYYEKQIDQVGREGDFHTSVSVGPLFGELLAWRFARWLQEIPFAGPLQWVEAGAHQGQLAADILRWLAQRRPALLDRLTYLIVEPSPRRRAEQEAALEQAPGRVEWVVSLDELHEKTGGVNGVIFSNELLDAFPIHQLAWSAAEKRWRELGVGLRDDHLAWLPLPQMPTIRPPEEPFAPPREIRPEGFTAEVCPAATNWWRQAARLLQQGRLVTIDYGLEAPGFLDRPRGTLRAYRHHAHADDPLADPGEQDLTAHVNWTALREAGEEAGLTTECLEPQGTFLTKILRDQTTADPSAANLSSKQVRQFQTLTHPQHFGTRFQALVQQRQPAPE